MYLITASACCTASITGCLANGSPRSAAKQIRHLFSHTQGMVRMLANWEHTAVQQLLKEKISEELTRHCLRKISVFFYMVSLTQNWNVKKLPSSDWPNKLYWNKINRNLQG